MTIRRRKKAPYEDSSALSDLAFLLIIYFIIIAGFNINKGFLMNLPVKDSTRLVLKEDLMRFELDDAGDLYYHEESIDIFFAEREINSVINARPNLAVVLTAAPACPWQSVVSFMELCEKLGVDSFSFLMQKEEVSS